MKMTDRVVSVSVSDVESTRLQSAISDFIVTQSEVTNSLIHRGAQLVDVFIARNLMSAHVSSGSSDDLRASCTSYVR